MSGVRTSWRRNEPYDADKMSTTRPTDRRTDTKPNDAPDTYALASELGVDATLLDRFVEEHPRPTPAIVLGWAFDRAELPAPPEDLREDVAAWLDARPSGGRPASEEELRETALRSDVLSRLVGGDAE